MITHIFYSLVLFPHIQHGTILSGGWKLGSLSERGLGTLTLIFLGESDQTATVYFTHKDFCAGSSCDIRNWKIDGNLELKGILCSILKEIDETRDFLFFDDKKWNRTRPFGVVLTITSKCNLWCYYCFNDIDYDLKERNLRENHGLNYWKNIIDQLHRAGTRVIILTGGEPMMAPFFWELLDYLKGKNIFIHINTNGTLLNETTISRLSQNYALNIMVSMHEFNDRDYYEINRRGITLTLKKTETPEFFQKAFSRKIEQLRKIKNFPNIWVEFLTILNWKNILNFEELFIFGEKCGIKFHNWQFFRLYSTHNNKGASKQMMDLAINKLYLMNQKYKKNYKIVDPVPFCVTKNTERASQVIDGVLSDTHDVKTIITTEGYVQMMSAYDNNFWNIDSTSIEEIFQSDFVQKQLNNGFLPKDCYDCPHKESCRGGSRMDAHTFFGDYGAFDPIGDIKNKPHNPIA